MGRAVHAEMAPHTETEMMSNISKSRKGESKDLRTVRVFVTDGDGALLDTVTLYLPIATRSLAIRHQMPNQSDIMADAELALGSA